ncbi:MAG: RraA family protein [Erysipelotrichaceae bacterium]|nr:RraA family protein [Erysipelotrichaceae bacterium]
MQIPTGNIADNNPNGTVLSHPLKALNPLIHMIGRAFIVECAPGDNLALYRGIKEAEEGDVLVFDCKGYCQAGHFGDMMANACKKKGIAGVIVNGTTRDYEDILKMKFPLYSLGYCPDGTTKNFKGEIKEEIRINGKKISKGDLLIGDGDGVVVIPKNEENEVIEKAILKHHKEKMILEEIDKGKSILEIYGFDKILDNA